MATIAYKYRITRVVSDEKRVMDEIRNGHRLYNDLVAIERTRREETRLFWAEKGGYADKLEALRAATGMAAEAVKLLPRGDASKAERKAIWAPVDALREEIWALERTTADGHSDPAKARRKARARELTEAAKARGEKVSGKEFKLWLAAELDADPECTSPRDRMRLEIQAEYEARGVAVSGKAMAQRLRDAGLVSPTEHIEAKARKAAYDAYIARGVSPGTRALVTEAHEKSLEKLGLREQRFSQWDGHGAFGVQIQGGATPDALLSGDHPQLRLCRLEDPHSARTGGVKPGSRRAGRRHLLRVRIASDEKKRPIFADFESSVDRPLPPDAKITQAKVTCDLIGLHPEWHVVFTCSVPDDVYRKPAPEQRGVVAVDVGWRSYAGDLRVGYWADDRGGSGEICTPTMRGPKGAVTMREKYAHARDIQSMQARLFYTEDKDAGVYGGILTTVADWLDAQPAATLPEWLAEDAQTLRRWRSQARLNRLAERWLRDRFDGDEAMLGTRDEALRARTVRDLWSEDPPRVQAAHRVLGPLDAWRRIWRHHQEWQDRETQRVLRARREHYRIIAARLARSYSTIIVNGADLASARVRKSADRAQELVMIEDRKRSQAFDAAPGELREEIIRAAKKYGATVIKQAFDTKTCHACGATCVFDRAKRVHHECEHCGCRWDQDFNACRNALRERPGGDNTTGPARRRRKSASDQSKPHADGCSGEAAE